MNDQTVYLVAPSRDFRSNVLSISKAVTTMHLLNYRTAILSGSYNSIIKARNGMIDSIKELGDTRRIVRAWLMDDDNQIEAPIKDLVDGIKYADENKISVAGESPMIRFGGLNEHLGISACIYQPHKHAVKRSTNDFDNAANRVQIHVHAYFSISSVLRNRLFFTGSVSVLTSSFFGFGFFGSCTFNCFGFGFSSLCSFSASSFFSSIVFTIIKHHDFSMAVRTDKLTHPHTRRAGVREYAGDIRFTDLTQVSCHVLTIYRRP